MSKNMKVNGKDDIPYILENTKSLNPPASRYINHLSHRNQPILLVNGTTKVLWTPPEVVDALVLPWAAEVFQSRISQKRCVRVLQWDILVI